MGKVHVYRDFMRRTLCFSVQGMSIGLSRNIYSVPLRSLHIACNDPGVGHAIEGSTLDLQAVFTGMHKCFRCRGVQPKMVIGHSMGGKVALEYGARPLIDSPAYCRWRTWGISCGISCYRSGAECVASCSATACSNK